MELFHRSGQEAKRIPQEVKTSRALGSKAMAKRVEMSVQRPDGTLFEYTLPTTPLNVIFTTDGIVELSAINENY